MYKKVTKYLQLLTYLNIHIYNYVCTGYLLHATKHKERLKTQKGPFRKKFQISAMVKK